MNRKAGIQISVNFLVVMIISIVIISLGFVLINRMVGTGGNEITDMDSRLRLEIERILDSENKLVAIPTVQKTIERRTGDYFGIGVKNLELTSQKFRLNVTFHEAYDSRTGEILGVTDQGLINKWITQVEEVVDIRARDQFAYTVIFSVPNGAQQGEYVFNVSITNSTNGDPASDCFNDYMNCYDNSIHKLYVRVI